MLLPGSIIWAAAAGGARLPQAQVEERQLGPEPGGRDHPGGGRMVRPPYSVVGGLLADAVTDNDPGAFAVLVGLIVAGRRRGRPRRRHPPAGLLPRSRARPSCKIIDVDDGLIATLEKLAIPICGTIVAVELISRFLGARSAKVAATGTALGGVIYLTIGLIPLFLGLMGPRLLPSNPDPEQTVARLAELFLPGALYIAFIGAVVSAIMSTVHSALHAPASQISHNIVVRLIPHITDRGKLWSVRATVMALCCVAYAISITSQGIHELVETASAFGSAGVFVATMFALFTRFGGPASAYVSVAAGLVVWAAGKYALGLTAPYLLGLLAATIAYVGVALLELGTNERLFRKWRRNR